MNPHQPTDERPEHHNPMSRRAALALSGAACLSALSVAQGQPQSPAQTPGQTPPQTPGQAPKDGDRPAPALVVFLLRHGETTGEGAADPELSPQGQSRAARVGLMLRSVGVQRVMHTPARRARQTGEEIARVCGVGLGSYDPFDPQPVVDRMIAGGGVWVMVGHSNTVPDLAKRLGGDPRADRLPESAYDDLFMVVRAGGGVMTVPLHSV